MRNLLFLLVIGTLINCSSDPNDEVTRNSPLTGLPDKGAIRFDDPAIGQRNYYVYFNATHTNVSTSYDYFGDTLVVGITSFESNKWVIKEFLTEGSISKKNKSGTGPGSWKVYADSIFVSQLKIDGDSVYLTRSPNRTFYSFAFMGRNWAFPVVSISDTNPLNSTCSPAFYYKSSVWMEYSKNYLQLGTTFDHLNIHFDYRDMATDGFGFIHAYGMPYGFVRIAWVNYWTLDKANGWDLLMN